MVLKAQPVVDLLAGPGHNIDDQINGGLFLDGGHAEELGDVDDADAADFNVVADQLRGGAPQGVVGDLADLHRVVGDEPVAPL